MLLVADSSSLITLSVAESLHLLELLYGEVKVPLSVYNEVTPKSKPESAVLDKYLQDKTIEVSLDEVVITDYSLGSGEIEAMILYKRLKADLLLIDDKRARKIAGLNDIKTIGSLGVLMEAKERKMIYEIRPALLKIYKSDIYISSELYNYVLIKSGEKPLF